MRDESAIWELLAFVKVRGVGGQLEFAKGLEEEIREIIHRKASLIDRSELANETLRIRTGLEQRRAAVRRRRDIDIKYGQGGMLDIYFAIRFLQLCDNIPDDDATRSTDASLEKLRRVGSLDEEPFNALITGYRFLSELDHNIRLTVGRSTKLPVANVHALQITADRMGLDDIETMLAELEAHRVAIRSAFDTIVRP
jgi:glutamate-ammonia-ligase adenylyltransferase